LSSLLFNRICMHNMSKRHARNSKLEWLGCTCLTTIANSQKRMEASNIHPTLTLWKWWSNLLFPCWKREPLHSTVLRFLEERRRQRRFY
jgi:hypothetical protein